MNIIALLGSPRPQGNSTVLAQAFLAACQERGATVTTHFLNTMKYKGCQACMGCKTKAESCILQDDLTPVYEAIKAADVLVIASPVYFGDLSGQLKGAFDRFYAYFDPNFATRLPAGKQSVFILTQGHPDEGQFGDIFGRYENFMKWLSFSPNHLIRACGLQNPGEVKDRPQIVEQVTELAAKIMTP